MKNILSLLTFTIMISSCSQEKKDTFTYWINSAKVDCVGVAPMTCYQVQKSDTLDPKKWTLLYSEIKGFDFEPGYIYKLKIEETVLKPTETPADKSNIEFTLVEQLDKIKNERNILHDIYVLESLNSKKLDFNSEENAILRPQIEINTTKMMISGTDGCNRISARIKNLTPTAIELGSITSTRKMCRNMTIAQSFNKNLTEARLLKSDGLLLYLLNVDGKELIKLKKVD